MGAFALLLPCSAPVREGEAAMLALLPPPLLLPSADAAALALALPVASSAEGEGASVPHP